MLFQSDSVPLVIEFLVGPWNVLIASEQASWASAFMKKLVAEAMLPSYSAQSFLFNFRNAYNRATSGGNMIDKAKLRQSIALIGRQDYHALVEIIWNDSSFTLQENGSQLNFSWTVTTPGMHQGRYRRHMHNMHICHQMICQLLQVDRNCYDRIRQWVDTPQKGWAQAAQTLQLRMSNMSLLSSICSCDRLALTSLSQQNTFRISIFGSLAPNQLPESLFCYICQAMFGTYQSESYANWQCSTVLVNNGPRYQWTLQTSDGTVVRRWQDDSARLKLTGQWIKLNARLNIQQTIEVTSLIAGLQLRRQKIHKPAFIRLDSVLRSVVGKALIGGGRIPTPFTWCCLRHRQLFPFLASLRILPRTRFENHSDWVMSYKTIIVGLMAAEQVLRFPSGRIQQIPNTVLLDGTEMELADAMIKIGHQATELRTWLYTVLHGQLTKEAVLEIDALFNRKLESFLPLVQIAEHIIARRSNSTQEDWAAWCSLRCAAKDVSRLLPSPYNYRTVQIHGMNGKDAHNTMISTVPLGEDILLPSREQWKDAIIGRLMELHAQHHASCKVTLQTYPPLHWIKEIKLRDAVQLRIILLLPCNCFTN